MSMLDDPEEVVAQASGYTEKDCKIEVLECDPGKLQHAAINTKCTPCTPHFKVSNVYDLLAADTMPFRIVLCPLDLYLQNDKNVPGLRALLKCYSIPGDFVQERLRGVTHSFGVLPKAMMTSIWFHFLCKDVAMLDAADGGKKFYDPRFSTLPSVALDPMAGDGAWLRSGYFLQWSDTPNARMQMPTTTTSASTTTTTTTPLSVMSQAVPLPGPQALLPGPPPGLSQTPSRALPNRRMTLLVFGPTSELRDRLEKLAGHAECHKCLTDPFALLVVILDDIWQYVDDQINKIRDALNPIEEAALKMISYEPDFQTLHSVANHAIYLRESVQAAISIAERCCSEHLQLIHSSLSISPEELRNSEVHGRLLSKAVLLEGSSLRLSSIQSRIQNLLNLSFNIVVQRDSNIMKEDSRSMRTMATMTIWFLPAASIAAIFGSPFFYLSPRSRSISLTTDFWLFWAVTIPITIAVLLLFYSSKRISRYKNRMLSSLSKKGRSTDIS